MLVLTTKEATSPPPKIIVINTKNMKNLRNLKVGRLRGYAYKQTVTTQMHMPTIVVNSETP
jgi:hypothetical protein